MEIYGKLHVLRVPVFYHKSTRTQGNPGHKLVMDLFLCFLMLLLSLQDQINSHFLAAFAEFSASFAFLFLTTRTQGNPRHKLVMDFFLCFLMLLPSLQDQINSDFLAAFAEYPANFAFLFLTTRAQEHKSTRAQEHKSTRAQKHKDTRKSRQYIHNGFIGNHREIITYASQNNDSSSS